MRHCGLGQEVNTGAIDKEIDKSVIEENHLLRC